MNIPPLCSDFERKSRSLAQRSNKDACKVRSGPQLRMVLTSVASRTGRHNFFSACFKNLGYLGVLLVHPLIRSQLGCSFIDGGPVVLGRYQPLMAPEVSACEWRKGSQVRALLHDSDPRAVAPDGRFFSRCVETSVCWLNWNGMIERPIRIRILQQLLLDTARDCRFRMRYSCKR